MSRMTLSDFAERVHGMIWADGWHDLDEIADRLEEELSELDSMRCRLPEEHEELADGGCYDDEDYAAAMWVREHGGVEGLKARMLPDGIEWPRYDDGEPVRLGGSYEKTSGIPGTAMTMQLRLYGDVPTWIIGKGKGKVSVKPGERVKRPAPKVLDADGVEIREGDTVYLLPGDWCDAFPCFGYHGGEELEVFSLRAAHVEGGIGCRDTRRPTDRCYPQPSQLTHRAPVLAADGMPLRVGETVWLLDDDGRAKCECEVIFTSENIGEFYVKVKEAGNYGYSYVRPSSLTHKRPVLDADGRPLREGEHVYHVETGAELVVKELPKPGEYQAVVVFAPPASHLTSFDPDQLTHERPDSWERLEEDCAMFASEYAEKHGLEKDGGGWGVPMRRDLVRRAKKLAERGA